MAHHTPVSKRKHSPRLLSRWTDLWGNLTILFILYTLFNLAWTYFHWGGPQHVILIANLLSFAPSVLASLLACRVTLEKSLDIQIRRAWLILALAFFSFLLGNLVWAYLEVVLHVEPFPSLADVFYLAFYPLGLWGLLSMPRMPQGRRERLTFWLDLLIVLTAAAMFVAYFIIIPTAAVSGNDLVTQVIAPAYPIGSLFVLGGILALLYRQPPLSSQSALDLLLIGMLFFVSGDIAFGYTSLTGTYTPGNWTDASWNVAQLFFALAALRQLRRSSISWLAARLVVLRNKLIAWLPMLAIFLGYGLVMYVLVVKNGVAAEGLLSGALLLTLLVIARQIISPTFKDLPIRVKVILTMIMVSVLSVSLVSAMAYLTIRSNLEAVVGERLKTDVQVRAQTLANEVQKQLDLIEGFALDENLQHQVMKANADYKGERAEIETQLRELERSWQNASDTDPMVRQVLTNALSQELTEFVKNFPTQSDLLLTNKYGGTIAATTRPRHYLQDGEEWWQSAYNGGRGAIYIGEPTFDADSQSVHVLIAIPVHTDHSQEISGIIRTTYRIQNILDVFALTSHYTRDHFDLLLPSGKRLTQHGTLTSLDALTRATLEAHKDANYIKLDFDGGVHLLSQAPVILSSSDGSSPIMSRNWTLITYEDPTLTFAPLNTASRTALLTTIIVLLLTALMAVVLSQMLVAPIARLTQVAAQIAEGDTTTQAQIEARDEIGTLARTFNSMLSALARTQEKLLASEVLHRRLVDYSPDMIAVHSQGRYLYINPAGVSLLGATSADQLIGKSLLDLIPPQDRERVRQGIEQTQKRGEPTDLIEQTIRRLDGPIIQVELTAIPILYDGQPAIQTVMRDITARKRAEEKIHQLLTEVEFQKQDLEIRVTERTEELKSLNERLQNELSERQQLMTSLQQSEERFRLLFDASPDAIFLLDPHDPDTIWPIIDCNQAAGTMNGYTREELLGQPLDLLNQKKGTREDFALVLETLRRASVVRGVEVCHLHKDGHAFPIEYSTTLVRVGDRELVLGIDRDITERRNYEDALSRAKEAAEESRLLAEAASRAKSEFLSRMSHELRTPMNAILGFAQLLEMSRKDPLTLTQQERVRQIVKGGQHLLDLINEILDISRIEANRLQISPEPVSARESIQEVLDLTVPLAVKRQIQLVTKFGTLNVNPYVLADRQRLKQILLNLVSNAVKYNVDGGTVIIKCNPSAENRWRISITDSGPGISPEDRARLFVPFQRLVPEQANVEGTGLGLVLARRLVELMHGQLGVESIVGQGSTFWIELPAAESPLKQWERSGFTGGLSLQAQSTRTLLYVEDNVANYELIQQVLRDYSQIQVIWAADARTGLELAAQRQPDLILLDLHLGTQDGSELLQQWKRDGRTRHIPVIVISADATSGQAERLRRLGAESYLNKPIDVKHFVRMIEQQLTQQES